MLFSKHINSFLIYNLILLFLFSSSVAFLNSFIIINHISYVLFHYVIIYLVLYYYTKSLYIIYFIYGLAMDILLIDQIGPHLLFFMLLIFFFNRIKKYFMGYSSLNIYFIILLTQLLIFFLEMIYSHLLFNYSFDIQLYLKLVFIIFLSSYPVFKIFQKIDNFK